MKTFLFVFLLVPLTLMNTAQAGSTTTYRCQNSQLIHVGDSAVIIESKCGEPFRKEVVNTGKGNSGQMVTKWYYPMKSGWYGVLTIRAGELVKISEIRK